MCTFNALAGRFSTTTYQLLHIKIIALLSVLYMEIGALIERSTLFCPFILRYPFTFTHFWTSQMGGIRGYPISVTYTRREEEANEIMADWIISN